MAHAFRMLLKRPAFTLVGVLTLAVGIGANTAIFSVVNGVLLRPLPYPQPDRIMRLYEQSDGGSRQPVSGPNFLDWRERSASFSAMSAYAGGTETILGGTEPVFAAGYGVSDGFFRVFGVGPAIGRTFVGEEMRVNGTPAAIVSDRFWRRSLGGERDLGRLRVVVEGLTVRIVGVMPPEFAFPPDAELWMPLELFSFTSARTAHNYRVVARLKDGVTPARAAAEMNMIAAHLRREYGTEADNPAVAMSSLDDSLRGSARDPLLLLLGAVGLVLLIACANVASTMLARGEERRVELAVRAALGASRARLIRQLLAESLALAVAGAAGGLLLAAWLVRALGSTAAAALPKDVSIGLDGRVLLFTVGLTLVTPLLFGLVPSLHVSRADLRDALAEGLRGSSSPVRRRVRAALVAAEVAVALLLLVGSALLVRSFVNVLSIDPGFDPRGAITASMAMPASPQPARDAPRAAQFYDDLLRRIRAVPGIRLAGAVNQLPFRDGDYGGGLRFEGGAAKGYASYRVATPGYLEAMGIRLTEGRMLTEQDRAGAEPAAVVNEKFAQQYFAGRSPLGARFQFFGMDPSNPMFTIVGVTGNVHHRSLLTDASPEVYVSALQQPYRAQGTMTIVVRAERPAMAPSLVPAVREAVRLMNADVPVEFATLDRFVGDSVSDRRFLLTVLGAFAAIALLLAASGIYGVLAYSVAQRTQEIGIRMALGANPRSVVTLVLSTAMSSVGAGLVAGCLGAALAVRAIRAFLVGVRPFDPAAFAAAVALLVAVALVAAYLPARRATRVDPLRALRAQ